MGAAAARRAGESPATYEIHLGATPPDDLLARFPTRVRRMPEQTVFRRRVTSQDELSDLLDRVLATGLALDEVHELRVASSPPHPSAAVGGQRIVHRAYEVRVDGQVGRPLLRYLRWQYRYVPEHPAVCLEGSPDLVHDFLCACFQLRLGIQSVRRIDPVSAQA